MEIIRKLEIRPAISIKLDTEGTVEEAVDRATERIANALDAIGEDCFYVIGMKKVYYVNENGEQIDKHGNLFKEDLF